MLEELIAKDRLPEIFFVGYSMGGNLVVKMAGTIGKCPPRQLRGVCAVCPSFDLAASSDASSEPKNLLYRWYFLRRFKRLMRKKAQLFPERYHVDGFRRLRTMRQWHEVITAPSCGYRNADDYYFRASALRVVDQICVPALILAAQDDPIVPIASLRQLSIESNPFITLITPEHGGHCGFISRNPKESFWAEPRIVEFCAEHSDLLKARRSIHDCAQCSRAKTA